MNEENNNRINQLEGLFAEQDHALQTLNDVVVRQDREISALLGRLDNLEAMVKSLRESFPAGADPAAFEKPPHY